MKVFLLLTLSLCLSGQVIGQAKRIHLPNYRLADSTNYWQQWAKSNECKVGLEPLEKSPHPFHFRISSTGGEIIEIWQQSETFQGTFTEWVKDADNDLRPFERFYFQHYALDTSQAVAISELIKNSAILQLPSDESIKGWQQGFDGVEIVIQYSDNKNYYLKNYWTPSSQNGLAEAQLVQQFQSKLLELANATIVRKSFRDNIPFPSFINDNGVATIRAVSYEDYWKHKRDVYRYVRSMKREKE
ncbi:hypothetical protein ACFQ48_01385 [Hymenobacter caeli]|uniref:GLPGLI family protein n=1 Tax=Hymenobacter caeli TaxID=2735894 RepID=A0ABX2FK24_9BACT|nr:hypothetical protein [Hymenobacter caeli]NRT17473.1 hypothetical protein [Hymenobacter caeli]